MQTACLMQDDRVVIPRVWVARTFWERALGLIGRRTLPDGQAMWLSPCRSIHTGFMRFALDIWFFDGAGHVVRAVSNLAPWRMAWGGGRAVAVLETAAHPGGDGVTIDPARPVRLAPVRRLVG